jgi:hypothetical protein
MKTVVIILHNSPRRPRPVPQRAPSGPLAKRVLMRLLILLAAVILLILAFRSLLPRPREKKTRGQGQLPEQMVACSKCRLYLPESEALRADENFFCNREHHRAWLEDRRQEKD